MQTSSNKARKYRFKINDRVVGFKKNGDTFHGTVKWVGMYEPLSVPAVGIETDEKVTGNEMESCLPSKPHLFTPGEKKSSLFIREEEVILEADFTNTHSSQSSQQLITPPLYEYSHSNPFYSSSTVSSRVTQPSGQHKAYTGSSNQNVSAGLGVGSPVQLMQDHSCTGVIRWIGPLPEIKGTIAGVELDAPMDGCEDGVWNGHRYFICNPGRAFFCPVTVLRSNSSNPQPSYHGKTEAAHNPMNVSQWEVEDQPIAGNQYLKYLGDQRGIQGHQNSSHLDATIFGLFALSDVFDILFLNTTSLPSLTPLTPAKQVQRDIGSMLWQGIVNPLRKNGAVRFESVMKLRNKLEELGKMEGVNTSEKDPEEFLNMLFKHTLHVDPFIQIKRPYGTEPEFFVQLFTEFDESLKIPTIEKLLEKMFKEQKISFTEVPSKLLVQVPRYGTRFQTYKRIIPGIKFNLTPLLENYYECSVCGDNASVHCTSCDVGNIFCSECSEVVHRHKNRRDHKPEIINVVDNLVLLSVLCIETSHYVCFSRDSEGRWLFFDSMATRVFDQYNIPRGIDCTAQLNDWIYEGDKERLMTAGHRELPELVRRFTQDVYMCVYIQPDYGMFADESSTTITPPLKPMNNLQEQLTKAAEREKALEKEVDQLKTEKQQHIVELQQEKESNQQLQHQLQHQLQQAQQRYSDMQQALKREQQSNRLLQYDFQQEQQRNTDLRDRLDNAPQGMRSINTTVLMNTDFCRAERSEVRTGAIIGEGAWGKVERGVYKGNTVAVKSIHIAIFEQNTVDRLRREIAIMAQVRHPNLVRFIAAVLDTEAEQLQAPPMIITELLDINLREGYKQHRVIPSHHLSILHNIAYGLHYLHSLQQPIIHRDISAPNVLLQQETNGCWLAKISDFGSANFARLARTAGEGAIIYSAPETFPSTASDARQTAPLLTTAVDVFSYGIVACELVVGEMPSTERYRAMLLQVKSNWSYMHGLIERCTRQNPSDRLTMADILDELPQPTRSR